VEKTLQGEETLNGEKNIFNTHKECAHVPIRARQRPPGDRKKDFKVEKTREKKPSKKRKLSLTHIIALHTKT